MATEQQAGRSDLDQMHSNIARIEALTARLNAALAQRRAIDPALQGPGPEIYRKAAETFVAQMMADPSMLLQSQAQMFSATLKQMAQLQQAALEGTAPSDPGPSDRRFAAEIWQNNPWFNFVKQQYLLGSEAVQAMVASLQGLTDREKKKLSFYSQQMVDALAPTNFLATNPEALQKAMETNGASLVEGMENLVADLERNRGDLLVTLADRDAFDVGGNLATTPGKVVYRNRLFELIQYTPQTETVHEIPLVIFPPWINKFYILDLKPQNSMIRWLVGQGYTLFVVSWVNPDASYADVGMDHYLREGFLEALRVAGEICKVPQVNAVGYCIAGTTLALTLAWAKQEGLAPVANATFFTTLTDFSDQGEVGVFLDDDFVDGLEREATSSGILDSFYMSRTFSYLRSNDLIYQPAVRNYLMGEKPPAFDLLFWNGDGTNLPGRMAVEYLRGLCQADQFARGGFPVAGRMVSIRDVEVPLFAVACESDHIAAWRASFNGIVEMGARDKTFVLAGSGHIAGIVNPPSRVKYAHWWGGDLELDPEGWKASAQSAPGSWWPLWDEWLSARSGKQVKARKPAARGKYKALCDAPGTYVLR